MPRKTLKFQAITVLTLVLLAPSLVSGIAYAQNMPYPITSPITPPITPNPTPSATPIPVTPPTSPKPSNTPVPTPVTPPTSSSPSPTPIPVTPPTSPKPSNTPVPTPVTPPTSSNHAPVITTQSLPGAHIKRSYFAQISFYDLDIKDNLKISTLGLPSWLKLNKCVINTTVFRKTYTCSYFGTPTKIGFYPIIVTVNDQLGAKTSKLLTLSVSR